MKNSIDINNTSTTNLVERFLDAHGKMIIRLQDPLITNFPFFSPEYRISVQWFEAWLNFGEQEILEGSREEQIEAVLKLCREKWRLNHKAVER